MTPLLLALLAAGPGASLAISADLTYANGLAPGNTFGLAAGARFTHGRMSLGLELQFLTPGSHRVAARDAFSNQLRWGFNRSNSFGSQGLGFVSHVPLCLRFGPLSTCGVASMGAVNVRGTADPRGAWHPLVSAGVRLAGEFPLESPVRLRASVQVLGGIVRPTDGFWSASPVQLGISLGVVFDAL